MKILISNDDGIDSPGLAALRNALSGDHEVWVAAPETERSGASHSVSLKTPVRFRNIEDRVFTCSGTPADCIMFSLLGALPVTPELIISGINLGPNLGTDIIFSGTAAAARQGALAGIPSIAVSAAPMNPPYPFKSAARFIADNITEFLGNWQPGFFYNVNVPFLNGNTPGIAVTYPSMRVYDERAEMFKGPDGDEYFFLAGDNIHAEEGEGTDWDAVNSGRISISPIYLHPVNQKNVLPDGEFRFKFSGSDRSSDDE